MWRTLDGSRICGENLTKKESLDTAFRLESKSCKGLFGKINFPPMRDLEFLTGHVTFNLLYNQT